MRFGSVCSGIEAASAAWHTLGWSAAWLAEIEPFPSAVLAHHYPTVPNLGDMTTVHNSEVFKNEKIDLLVGGTPCQSFSLAGLRGGMDDSRGQLSLQYCRIADVLRPRWVVWENVPGVLSADGGRAFGAIVGALAAVGYGVCWRVLDAQYFGVPQRRRRVFVVGYFGDWRPAAAVLFEPESVRGDIAPSRETGTQIAASITRGATSAGRGGYAGRRREDDVNPVAHTLRGSGHDASEDGTGRGVPLVAHALTTRATDRLSAEDTYIFQYHGSNAGEFGTLRKGNGHLTGGVPAVAFAENQRNEIRTANISPALSTGGDKPGSGYPAALTSYGVRQLTPRECERLQGFPDDYTLVPYHNKPAADGPRYQALGNSMAVPVMRWLGERIALTDAIIQAQAFGT